MTGSAPGLGVSNELVEVLLRNELGSIESEVAQGREEHILKTLDERGIAQELIGQQYSGRYPFELLQNANDAGVRAITELRKRAVRFAVTESALLVANMGNGFGPDEVRAICGLGRSSKDPRQSIGYKGIGFKSVAEITDVAQIISSPYRFTFSEGRVRGAVSERVHALRPEQRLPIYAFPFPLSGVDLGPDAVLVAEWEGQGFVTILRLPFKKGVNRAKVEADLDATLSPRLLLFLEATDRLEVLGTPKSFKAGRKVDERGKLTEMSLMTDGAEPEHWLVFNKRLAIRDPELVSRLGEKWLQVSEVGVTVAFPERGSIEAADSLEPFPLHVYFPTRERTGLPFIVNGDFYLEMDRRYISRTPEAEPYNQWLAAELANFIATDVGPALAYHYGGSPHAVSALSPVRDADNFGQVFRDLYSRVMHRSRFIPAIDGRTRLAGEALLLPTSGPRSLEAHEFLSLEDVQRLVIPSVDAIPRARSFLKNELEVSEMDIREAVGRLTTPADKQTRDRMYRWLANWASDYGLHLFARLLAEIPSVHTTSGAWMKPGARVYFPRERDLPDLSPDLPINIADAPAEVAIRALLSEAGVKPFRWRELLSDSVLPLLEDPDTQEPTRQRALETLRVYFQTEGGGDKDISSRVGKVLLEAETSFGNNRALRPASQIYFSQAWVGSDRLRILYGPFGRHEFLADMPPKEVDEQKALYEYLSWLGVADRPRLDEVSSRDAARYPLYSLGQHPHARYQPWWSDWAEAVDLLAQATCPQGHSLSVVLANSFGLDRLPEIIESRERDRLRALFVELASSWGATYHKGATAVLRCQHGWHSGARDRRIPSLLLHVLTHASWIPVSRGGHPLLAAPDEIWRVGQDMPHRVASLIAVLPAELDTTTALVFAQELGIVDSARAAAGPLMSLLNQFAEQFQRAEPDTDKRLRLVEGARWTMRRLNEALEGRNPDGVDERAALLLARLAGAPLFTANPYYSDDAFLSDIWQEEVPVLDGDRGLQRVKSFFKLTDLSEAVAVKPIATGMLGEESGKLRAHISQAAPYIAALAVETAPSRADIVRARLPRLEVVACQHLILSYQLGDIQKTRANLKTYIAKRLEGHAAEGTVRKMIGTVYVQSSPATPVDWYSLGRQLAEFLEVPTQGDAFAIVLASGEVERKRYAASRGLTEEVIAGQADALRSADKMDLPDVFLELFEETNGADGEPESPAAMGEMGADEAVDDKDADTDQTHQAETAGEAELPALDLNGISGVDGTGQSLGEPGVGSRTVAPTSNTLVDWQRADVESRRYGRRGEEAVVGWERRRLADLGYDPEAVNWQSQKSEFSDYDVASLDDDGQRIYIEVKSTVGDDESAPFKISAAELRSALRHRTRYFIYRVLDVRSARPQIVRYRDPMGRFQAAEATLNLGNAWMRLPPAS